MIIGQEHGVNCKVVFAAYVKEITPVYSLADARWWLCIWHNISRYRPCGPDRLP